MFSSRSAPSRLVPAPQRAVMIAAAWMLLGLSVAHGQSAADTSRIVTLGGAVTEIVYALGAGDQVVGVDASSVYPEAATEKPDVGYFREVPAEGVLSLDPSLILALDGTGPPAVLDQFRSAGVRTVLVPDEPIVSGTKQKIRKIGDLLGREAAADSLIRGMEEDLEAARALRNDVETTPRVLFIYARGTGSMSVAGWGSSAEAVIELAGAENAITGFEDYKPMAAEAVVSAKPDVILMLTRGLDSIGGVDGLLEQPGIPLTPAGKNRRIVTLDDLLLLGFGPRLGTAVKRLTKKLHPSLQSTAAASSPQP